jgi:hypothetical protein
MCSQDNDLKNDGSFDLILQIFSKKISYSPILSPPSAIDFPKPLGHSTPFCKMSVILSHPIIRLERKKLKGGV